MNACWACAGMNPYERAREERIASNRARLAALDLPSLATNFQDRHLAKPKKPSKPRGLAAAKRKKVLHPLRALLPVEPFPVTVRLSGLMFVHCPSRMEGVYLVVASHSGRLHCTDLAFLIELAH